MRSRNLGYTLFEMLLTLSAASILAFAVWSLNRDGDRSRASAALVLAVQSLQDEIAMQCVSDQDFSAVADPAIAMSGKMPAVLHYRGKQATQWGPWTLVPIPRTDADGQVVPAGGFRISLEDLPPDVCAHAASAFARRASRTAVDGQPVVGPADSSGACSAASGHQVTLEIVDTTKMGGLP